MKQDGPQGLTGLVTFDEREGTWPRWIKAPVDRRP